MPNYDLEMAESVIAARDLKIDELTDEIEQTTKLYNELLFAVAQKWPGETRHNTALRYIQERENASSLCGQEAETTRDSDTPGDKQ